MGTKATKIEGSYLPDTPTLNRLRAAQKPALNTIPTTPNRDNNALLDPRSPNGCRTPLNVMPAEAPQPVQVVQTVASGGGENTFAQLRKRLLKGFALNDPRSPQLNRTPLMLDEAIDRTLNMDDTFADLFVETRVPAADPVAPGVDVSPNNSSVEIVSLAYEEEDTMPCEMMLPATPAAQLSHDPRSPTVGVERTPIIFCDDDEAEARETQMLEEILETLTLNLSHESSMASFVSASSETTLDKPESEPRPEPQSQIQLQLPSQTQSRPANKHLERVRLGNKRRVAPRKPARASKPQIYVDAMEGDNAAAGAGVTSTPKQQGTPTSAQRGQRTPLSCVNKNRMHLEAKEPRKPHQQQLGSFDERVNVPSLRIFVAGENQFED